MITVRSLIRPASIASFFLLAFLLYSNAARLNAYLSITGWRKESYIPLDAQDSISTRVAGEELYTWTKPTTTPAAITEPQTSAAVESTSTPEPTPEPTPDDTPKPGDKVIVMGRMESEDASWVQKYLPDWQNAIYTVDNTSAPLSTPQNKGREANPYLLYIIQHYDKLPSILAFLHPHRDGWPGGWHTDAPGYDNVLAMQTLNLDFVHQNGYVNLRCNWVPGCPDEVQPFRSLESDDPENVEHHMLEVWHHFFGAESNVPEAIAQPCCAQFAVSREQVLKRPLEDYEKYHEWLMETPMSDGSSGRIFEYLWHVIFGKEAVYCPVMAQCYRDVYGRQYG